MRKSVCRAAAATLDVLSADLEPWTRTELRDHAGIHMTLHVERVQDGASGALFMVAHRHVGRESIPDPEVTLLRTAEGRWTPLSIALPFSNLVTMAADGTLLRGRRGEHRRLVKLTEVWMNNVRVNLLKQDVLEEQEIPPAARYAAE
jgi:hypothetical protein